ELPGHKPHSRGRNRHQNSPPGNDGNPRQDPRRPTSPKTDVIAGRKNLLVRHPAAPATPADPPARPSTPAPADRSGSAARFSPRTVPPEPPERSAFRRPAEPPAPAPP